MATGAAAIRAGSCTGYSPDAGERPYPPAAAPKGSFRATRARLASNGVLPARFFLRGAPEAADPVPAALARGHDTPGTTDLTTMAGVMRLHAATLKAGIRPVIGSRTALPRNCSGWSDQPAVALSPGRVQNPGAVTGSLPAP